MEQLIKDIQEIYNRIKSSDSIPSVEKDLLKKKIQELYEEALNLGNATKSPADDKVDVDTPPKAPEMSASDILREKDSSFITLEMEEAEKEIFDDSELFDEEPAPGEITYTPPVEEKQEEANEEELVEEPQAEEKPEDVGLEEEVVEPVAETPVEETKEEEPTPEPEPIAEETTEEPVVEEKQEEVEQPVAEEAPAEEENEEPKVIEQLSLNDLAAENTGQQNIASKFTEAPVDDLLKTIPVYKRFEFIAELFNKDNEGFDKAVKEINAATSADQAFAYVHDTLVPQYKWDEDSELVMDFVAFVRRRFTR